MSALIPVFIIILLGYAARRSGFLPESFWPHAERATYFVFFPCLLVRSLATAHVPVDVAIPMYLTMAGATLTVALLAFVVRPLFRDGPAFSSVFQGSIRINTYVGVAAVAAVYGTEGTALSAVAMLAMVPTVNLLCVPVVARFGGKVVPSVRNTLFEVVRNPLILACLVGLGLNISGVGLPFLLMDTVDILSRATLPIGLAAVGAGLEIRTLRGSVRAIAASTILKMIILPCLVALYAGFAGLEGTPLAVAVLFGSLPVAASSYILARQLGGDRVLMASIITLHIPVAAVTMPLAHAVLL